MTKRNRILKLSIYLLHIIAMLFIFVLFVDQQTALFVRDIFQNLGVDASIQTLFARMYFAIKMMFDVPSLMGIFIVVLNVMHFACVLTVIVWLFVYISKKIDEEIKEVKYRTLTVRTIRKERYLEHVCLRN